LPKMPDTGTHHKRPDITRRHSATATDPFVTSRPSSADHSASSLIAQTLPISVDRVPAPASQSPHRTASSFAYLLHVPAAALSVPFPVCSGNDARHGSTLSPLPYPGKSSPSRNLYAGTTSILTPLSSIVRSSSCVTTTKRSTPSKLFASFTRLLTSRPYESVFRA